MVDADLRRPSQHLFFDVDNSVGLIDYLQGKTDLEEVIKTTKIDNLSFIPSGQMPDESVGILNSQRMTDLVRKLKTQYDLVFFDSPPILGVSDGSVLASEVDMTIMVVQHRRFPRAMLQRVKQAVVNVGGRLIGVVLNNVDARHDEGYGYYNQHADYYARAKETRRAESQRAAPPPPPPRVAREEREIIDPMRLLLPFLILAALRRRLVKPWHASPGDVFEMRLGGMSASSPGVQHHPSARKAGWLRTSARCRPSASHHSAPDLDSEQAVADKIFTPLGEHQHHANLRTVTVGGSVRRPAQQWSDDVTLSSAIAGRRPQEWATRRWC